ncbi:MAG: AbrB/MazE/SpoVT family DNA-binding domain-containing protein [Halobacteriaceae archaeon]
MTVETDSHGRIYIPAELRKKYGEKFHVVEYEDRIELIPVDDEPLEAVHDEIGDTLEGISREELREKAIKRAEKEAKEDMDHINRVAEENDT